MSMLSPESYIAELQDAPYEQLVEERRSIIAELERQEKGLKDPSQPRGSASTPARTSSASRTSSTFAP